MKRTHKNFSVRNFLSCAEVSATKAALASRVGEITGIEARLGRVRGDALMVAVSQPMDDTAFASVKAGLLSDRAILAVERVRVMKPLAAEPFSGGALPNDALLSAQWSLTDPASGINAASAWAAAGTGAITVAVLDTGFTPHPDLDLKWVPGADLISDSFIAADSDARDADAADAGDFEDYGECGGARYGSSWHGTHLAGIIGAQTNNSVGIAGVAPNARIQPVRVLGRCGGLEDDIIDGMLWAAGFPVAGAANNPMPAKILNLSLGGTGPCTEAMQSAVDKVLSAGAAIVVAAGNESDDAAFSSPANCKGVITVAAANREGNLASYSNLGTVVKIMARGGDVDGVNQIISTLNSGYVGPTVSFYEPYIGTSMAAPHVAGTIALMLTRDPTLTPGQIFNRLRSSARAFDPKSECAAEPTACSGGMLDAGCRCSGTRGDRYPHRC